MILVDSQSKISLGGKTGEAFKMTAGVRQGDYLSYILFNLAIHENLKALEIRGTIMYKSKQCFAYADDIALMSCSEKYLRHAS